MAKQGEGKLTVVAVENAKPGDKARKLYDERGMYLLITPAGAKLWRLKYYLDGRERLCSLGAYPDVSLKEARDDRDAKRKLIAKGIGPVEQKREATEARREERRSLFGDAAERYYRQNVAKWSATHARDVRRMIDGELVPALGAKPLAEIKTADVQKLLDGITDRGAYTFAHDVKTYFSAIFRSANKVRADRRRLEDPALYVDVAEGAAEKPHASLEPHEVGPFLRKFAFTDATPLVRIAVKMLLLTAVRTGELRRALWSEIDVRAKLWRLPVGRMKARREHVVPLAPQTLALLSELRTMSGECDLLFPSPLDPAQPISENTCIAVLYRLGYRGKLTGHGMRSMFSTWAHEAGYPSDAIERQLAHAPRDKVKAAYLKSEFLPKRIEMMAAWANYLDQAERDASKVVPLRSVAK